VIIVFRVRLVASRTAMWHSTSVSVNRIRMQTSTDTPES
jgi:hypothetical protein